MTAPSFKQCDDLFFMQNSVWLQPFLQPVPAKLLGFISRLNTAFSRSSIAAKAVKQNWSGMDHLTGKFSW